MSRGRPSEHVEIKTKWVQEFKTSNRTNAKIKIKTWANENIDYIASADKLPGVPDIAVVLELGVGKSFIHKWRSEYNL